MRPRSGVSRPAIARSAIVLPEPEGPSKPRGAPSAVNSTASRKPGTCFSIATSRDINPFRTFWRAGLQSLCEISNSARICSARLQAGTLESSRCPPEGGPYMTQTRVLTQTLQPGRTAFLGKTASAAEVYFDGHFAELHYCFLQRLSARRLVP